MNKQKIKTTHIMIDYAPHETDELQWQKEDEANTNNVTRIFIESLGTEDTKAILVSDQIRLKLKYETHPKPHINFQYITGFISALVTEDPTRVHWDIIRATIKQIAPEVLNDKRIIDMMARALIDQCRKLKLKLKPPKSFQSSLSNTKTNDTKFTPESGRIPIALNAIELDPSIELESVFEKDGIFIWEKAFLEVLKNIGKNGNNAATRYREDCKERFRLFKREGKSPLDFWFNTISPTPENPFHLSPALQILANYIYEDIIKKTINFRNNYPPLLANKIHHSVNILHKGEIKKTDDQIQMFNEGSLIGSLPIAAIDQKLFTHVFRGVDKFRTVTGHRLLRFLPQQAHNQLASGINPCNILEYSGGYAQIADALGLNGKKIISDLKDLLHGLAFMKWSLPHFTGNFITLGQYKQIVTRNQNPGIKITLGPELSPYYASKQRTLLIPILKDPQLVGPTQFYANQYLLQNEIMAEFSNQSIKLAEDGFVIINENIWELGKLPKRIKELVKECWIRDGDNGERFLEKIDKNIYTLAPAYYEALKFLKEQGELRKQRSREAKLAIEKRKKNNIKTKRYPSFK